LEISQQIGRSNLIIAYTKGTCSIVDNSMYLVETNQIPSRPFASFSFGTPTEIPFLIRAEYDKIVINGSDVFDIGTNTLCVSNDAITANNYRLMTVKKC
jgi:hypothetical protein